MKLRIKGNSIRMRLTRAEVAALADGRTVSQTTRISATAGLTSSIGASRDLPTPAATLENNHLHLALPEALVHQWAHSDEVSIAAQQQTGAGEALALLVEKDFECLHHPSSTDDTFPNPRAGKSCG